MSEQPENYADGGAVQFALRELRITATDPRSWVVFALIILVLGFSGPFETYTHLSVGPRFAYWAIMVLLTFATGAFFSDLATYGLRRVTPSGLTSDLLVGVIAAVPVSLMVGLINILTFTTDRLSWTGIFITMAFSAAVTILVCLVRFTWARHTPGTSSSPSARFPKIVARLPHHLRGELISMSVQDHYVDVTTSKGHELVLIRFRDALDETGDVDGLRIHRSHWIAIDAISEVVREGSRVLIKTHSGAQLPVSRSFLPKLKERNML